MARWLVLVVGAGLVFLLVKQVASQHPEVTVSPHVTPSSIPRSGKDILLSLCPPKTKTPVKVARKNVLIVSTLDGQLTALDLSKEGEMMWSTPTYPGPMLESTISQMELDNRGQWVRLIPSLTGNLYKFNGNEVEPMPMDAGGLLSSSLKMQDNFVFTGGKETRTMGIDLKTGELQYECSMDGDCKKFSTETDSETLKDVLVVQRNTQTVKAHTPRTGDIKWNFSVSLHDVKLVPGQDLCKDVETETAVEDEKEIFNLKTVVPDGVVCAVDQENDDQIKWRRKFQSPIVDVWKINGPDIVQVDLFSKNNVKKRESSLLDDDDDPENDESPHLYMGVHNKQLYIQESILMAKEAEQGIQDYQLNPSGSETAFPRVSWKPYLVSPSRTPYFDLGASKPDLPLISFDQHLERTDSKTTSLAIINSDKADYPLDSGFYLYQDRTELDPNMTTDLIGEEELTETITVQFIYMNLWHWWKEVVFISMVTALLMNLLIYRPLVHEMRDNFQQRSRDLVTHFQAQLVKSEHEAANQMKENIVVVEVPVHVPMSNSNNTASTPLTPSTGSSDKSLFSTQLPGQTNDFTSRYLSDFEPLQCLGRGGFGVVFESKNKYDDIHYAVKRITLPSSEERRRKVKREVRVLAKLEHRNIVRYFSTWEETPPVGWQESADSWLDDFDVGSGPTPYDPTSTDMSVASSVGRRKRNVVTTNNNNNNPLDPFRGFPSGNTTDSCMLPSMEDNSARSDIIFENSYGFSNSDGRPDRLGWGGDSTSCEIEFENSSSVVFEESGVSEAVSLQIDSSCSSDGSVTNFDKSSSSKEGSLSCVEAIDWDDNRNVDQESGESEKKEIQKKQRAYLYIVMQLCLKDTLRDWLRQHGGEQRKRDEVLDIFRQICVGVQYVHNQGLIHRDLKPSNIYFSSEGVIKIGDFGLVTNTELELGTGVSGDQQLSPLRNVLVVDIKNGQLTDQVGTQMYMSPEQLKQMPYGHKVDIFSLGLIFFELLAPFSTQMERLHVMSDAKKGHYPPHLASGVERELLDSMLHTRPDLRPEVGQILDLGWLQEEVGGMSRRDTEDVGERRRQDTLTSHQDILCEELLDN